MADESTPNENEPTANPEVTTEAAPVVEQPDMAPPPPPIDSTSTPSPLPVVVPEASTLSVPGSGGHNGLAIAGMIVGIVAVLSVWIPFWGLLVAVAAIVLSIIGLKKHEGKGFAITGIVTGGIGLLISLVVTGLFILALASAPAILSKAQQAEKDASSSSTQGQANPSAKKDFAMGDTADFNTYQVKVNSLKTGYTASDGYSTPSAGDQYIEVNMTVKNTSDTTQPVDSLLFTVLDNGVEKNASYIDGDTPLASGNLAPGASATGDVVYEVSANATGLKLVYDTYDSNFKQVTYTLAIQ